MASSLIEGTIEEVRPGGLWAVRVDRDNRLILATLSREARRIVVKLIKGDRVLLEVSDFDPNRGRITARVV